jgi:hypothetical protein
MILMVRKQYLLLQFKNISTNIILDKRKKVSQ